ncbi:hypothetical protein [Arthrobacter agilis]|nr:hypothetical protein [Arthrobacter agilis]
MTFTLDGSPESTQKTCSMCGATSVVIHHFILKDHNAFAIGETELHQHGGNPEAWINIVFGSFNDDEYEDHVTFGCRVGLFTEDGELASSLIDSNHTSPSTPVWGLRLTREQALSHDLLPAFWEVVDWLVLEDPQTHQHLYGHSFDQPRL